MSNLFKKLISFTLLLAVAFSTVSCQSKKKKQEKEESAAVAGKAVLNIYSFSSGYGSEWLTEAIKEYEELNKDVVIGDKKGIVIKPTTDTNGVAGATMAGRNEVVYFLEQQDYYELVANNYVADITPAITGSNKYDNNSKTLESKMYDDQISYLKRTNSSGKVSYYAYPHYFTSFGIVYDVDLFDSKGYYFADGYDANGALADMFLGSAGVSAGWAKTAGPDGTPKTSDDGLPTTYEEFLLLCRFISEVGNDNPLIWSGQHRDAYLTHFINALATDYEGKDQMRLNFTFDGYATNLGTVQGGQFVEDANDTFIDGTNGQELARQAGKYYAMDFYSDLYNSPAVNNADTQRTLYSSTYSHTVAQEDFLIPTTRRNAMLLDGSWWETEATAAFDKVVKANGSQYSKQNRRLGWMPLPKHSSKVGTKQTVYELMYPLCVVKNGLDVNGWEYKYALDFIQFINSDEQIAKFNQRTGCTKSLKYDLTDAQYKSLTYFGKSYYDAYKASDIVFPYDNNLLFANNQKVFQEIDYNGQGSPLYKSTDYPTCFVRGIENGKTASSYFSGMYTYFSALSIWRSSK